jgi:hypothetical protein
LEFEVRAAATRRRESVQAETIPHGFCGRDKTGLETRRIVLVVFGEGAELLGNPIRIRGFGQLAAPGRPAPQA